MDRYIYVCIRMHVLYKCTQNGDLLSKSIVDNETHFVRELLIMWKDKEKSFLFFKSNEHSIQMQSPDIGILFICGLQLLLFLILCLLLLQYGFIEKWLGVNDYALHCIPLLGLYLCRLIGVGSICGNIST